MIHNVINLRPIPIYISKTDYRINKQQEKRIKSLSYTCDGKDKVKVSQEGMVVKEELFKDLDVIFEQHVNFYLKNVLQISNEVYCTHSWATLNDKSVHHIHSHKGAFISLVYYCKSKGSNTFTVHLGSSSCQEAYDFDYNILNINLYNTERWTLDITEGDICIFPGWLKHSAETKGTKTMIGANYFLKGFIGSIPEKTGVYLKT